ncbi:MAG TPA: AI-2E family transporter [Actinomycetota bacterium]|nr:AI-2E family transporter [Actinomycetota bacterium]
MAERKKKRPEHWEDPRPPAWAKRLILWTIVALALAYLAWAFLSRVNQLLFWVLIALFLSFALEPAVNWLAGRGMRRGVATGLIFLAFALLGLLTIALMVPFIVEGVIAVVRNLPEWLDQVSRLTEDWFGVQVSTEDLRREIFSAESSLQSFAGDIAGNVIGAGGAALGLLFQVFTIGFFLFYLVAEGPKVRRGVCSLLPRDKQDDVLFVWGTAIEKTGGYFYSRLLLALINGVLFFAVLFFLDVPGAPALALFSAVISTFIPIVGTYVGAAVPLLVALASVGPGRTLVVLIWVILYQQVENLFLAPRISARTMELHPAVAFSAALGGGMLGGVTWAFLALPIAATIQGAASAYVERYEVIEDDLTREDVKDKEKV